MLLPLIPEIKRSRIALTETCIGGVARDLKRTDGSSFFDYRASLVKNDKCSAVSTVAGNFIVAYYTPIESLAMRAPPFF